jgi:hypothetical protein
MSKLMGFGLMRAAVAACKQHGFVSGNCKVARGLSTRFYSSSTTTSSTSFPAEGDASNEPWIPPYVPVRN